MPLPFDEVQEMPVVVPDSPPVQVAVPDPDAAYTLMVSLELPVVVVEVEE